MFEEAFLRQLIQRARAGDAVSFERIVAMHERLVLRVAQQILLNREAARDAGQEVFLRLHKNLARLDEERDWQAWLYRTTANVCFDVLRRDRRDLPLDVVSEPADEGLTPEEAFAAAQRRQIVLTGLRELAPRERQVIVLRDLEGHSTAEVARLLQLSEGTVRCHISTGRVKLKNFVLAQEGGRK